MICKALDGRKYDTNDSEFIAKVRQDDDLYRDAHDGSYFVVCHNGKGSYAVSVPETEAEKLLRNSELMRG